MKISISLCLVLLTLVLYAGPTNTTKFIVIDQFGYRPGSQKVAVIRDPYIGYDSLQSFTPGLTYQLRTWDKDSIVFSGTVTPWNGGVIDNSSGDKVWWFDFSSVTREGDYYVYDPTRNVGSYRFSIRKDVYNEVLKHAVRMLYYQRAGFAKQANYAGVGWADGASQMKPRQDKNARIWKDTTNAATERDVHGGWFDAGDQHRYSAPALSYHIDILSAFEENPEVWGDDYNIPESGNGIPDILDEWKYSNDWAIRMQLPNGAVLSVTHVNQQSSPPSSSTKPSVYGSPNTECALRFAAAFAMGYNVLKQKGPAQLSKYADTLLIRAKKSWDWAIAYPDSSFDIHKLASLPRKKRPVEEWLQAAIYLFEATGESKYKTCIDTNYKKLPLFMWGNFIDQWRKEMRYMLRYASFPNATPAVAADILTAVEKAMNKPADYAGKLKTGISDPYRAFLKEYYWGCNGYKSEYGITFENMVYYDVENAFQSLYSNASEDYIHYIHGVNPFGYVYLTNMNQYGAENSITQIWHTWFTGPLWDQVGVSTYGPPPGYLSGGANRTYKPDSASCPNWKTTGICGSRSIAPPALQPDQKSYKDFNDTWPDKAWEVTEPSVGYQVSYLRLLSKFAGPSNLALDNPSATLYLVNNFKGKCVVLQEGSYTMSQLKAKGFYNDDASSVKVPQGYIVELYADDNFAGAKKALTNNEPDLNTIGFDNKVSSVIIKKDDITDIQNAEISESTKLLLYPNPAKDKLHVVIENGEQVGKIELMDILGNTIKIASGAVVDVSGLSKGIYILTVKNENCIFVKKFVKE